MTGKIRPNAVLSEAKFKDSFVLIAVIQICSRSMQALPARYPSRSSGQIFMAMSATSINSCRDAPLLACTAMPVATVIT